MRRWANPSSPHAEGRAARAALEDARARIKAALGWEGELIFTSGASEGIAMAMNRAKCGSRLVSAIEHDSVLRAVPAATRLPVGADAALDPEALERELARSDRPLAAVQHVNSELGARQRLDRIAPRVREAGGLLFADCTQSAGKEPLPDADLIALSAHKFGGPPGIGALLARDFTMLEPGGGQEFGYRGGTENLAGVLGMAAALEAPARNADDVAEWLVELLPAIEALKRTVDEAGGVHVAGATPHFPAIATFAMPGVSAAAQLIRFDAAGIAVSSGSACASGTLKSSHVLAAIGAPPEIAQAAIRVSFGWSTTPDEIRRFAEVWRAIAERAGTRAA